MLFSQLFFAFFFFFNDTATTEIYTLSLHDALPISVDHVLARLVLLEPGHPRLLGRVAYHPGHRHVAHVLLHDLLGLLVVLEPRLRVAGVAPGFELLVEGVVDPRLALAGRSLAVERVEVLVVRVWIVHEP